MVHGMSYDTGTLIRAIEVRKGTWVNLYKDCSNYGTGTNVGPVRGFKRLT